MSLKGVQRYAVSEYLREVVSSFRFLSERFTLEYMSNVSRKRLYYDDIEQLCPKPMYRCSYDRGQASNALKRVTRMPVTEGVKTLLFKLETQTFPVLTCYTRGESFCRENTTVYYVRSQEMFTMSL